MPESEVIQRFQELKTDVNNALARIERTIEKLSDTIRTDYVTRREFDAELTSIRHDVDEIKASARWRVSGVVIPTASLVLSAAAIAVVFIIH